MENASVLVVGGGAIGGVVAALLSGSVDRLTVLDPAVAHASRMRAPGLRVEIDGEDRVVALDARTSPAELGDARFDYALITVKSLHLEAAVAPLRERDLADAYVSLGNGMVQPRLAAIVGAECVIAGVVEFGATNLGPGHVARTSAGGLSIGEPDGEIRDRTRRLAALMAPVAEVHLTANITGAIWSKLLVNSTFSAVGAVSGLTTGEALDDPAGRPAALALWREGCEVAATRGVRFEPVFGVDPRELLEPAVGRERAEAKLAEATAGVRATRASMLQDLERGVATEVDVINGAVAAEARAAGLATPVNDRVVAIVHSIERGERTRSREALAEIAAVGPYGTSGPAVFDQGES